MTPTAYNAALDQADADLTADYLAEVAGAVSGIRPSEVREAVERGDRSALLTLLGLGVLATFLERARTIYIAGGRTEAQRGATFDPRSPTAEAGIAAVSSGVQGEVQQGQASAIDEVLQAGARRGDTARQTAEALTGTRSAQTGRRTGGVTGLAGSDARAVEAARDQLLSGDPAQLREYLTRVRRDPRFDALVREAIDAATAPRKGDPLTAETLRVTAGLSRSTVDAAARGYATRLLRSRAEMVARTTALEAYNAGRAEIYTQMVAQGLDPQRIVKTWRTQGDNRVRDTHRGMAGQTVQGAQPFVSPSGARLMQPGDTSLGAGFAEVANCRCRAVYRVLAGAFGSDTGRRI